MSLDFTDLTRVKTAAATGNGAGNVTWTAAEAQFQLPPASISRTVNYTILDSGGSAWETGFATLAEAAGTYTLTRGGAQVVTDSSTGSALSLTNSSAHTVFITPDSRWLNRSVLMQSAQSPVGSDITGAVNTHYLCDISGLSANRNLTLPVALAGDRIRVTITSTDADYELIVKGAATVTINGGSAATEWARLCPVGDSVEFEATSTTNYQVVSDDRVGVVASRASDGLGGNLTLTGSTDAQFTDTTVLGGELTDDYSLWVSADDEFVLPVSGKWLISALGILAPHASSDQDRCRLFAYLNDTTKLVLWRGVSSGSDVLGGGGSYIAEFSKGDTLGLWATQYDADAWAANDSATNAQLFSVQRLLT